MSDCEYDCHENKSPFSALQNKGRHLCHAHTAKHPPTSIYPGESGCLDPSSLNSAIAQFCSYDEWKKRKTSCQSQSSTEPGFALPFSQTEELVKSLQRASTTFPFFSLATCGNGEVNNSFWEIPPPYLRVNTQVLPARQPETHEIFFLFSLLISFCARDSVVH